MKRTPASTTKGTSCGARPQRTVLPRTQSTLHVDVSPEDPACRALLEACCPVIYFHPDERYFPTSVEAFLAGMQIMRHGRPLTDATPAAMAQHTDPALYLGWKDRVDFVADAKPGRPLSGERRCAAPAYTHVVEKAGMLYLTYAFFYAYNGPLSFFAHLHQPHCANPLEHYWYFTWPHFGEHVGDWEHVTVRVDVQQQVITDVFFSAHGRGEWHAAETLRFEEGSHVVVQAALHTHASYPAPASAAEQEGSHYPLHDFSSEALDLANTLEFIWSGGTYFFKTIQAVDRTALGRSTWRPRASDGGLIALDAQPWLAFRGAWSPDVLVGFDGLGIRRETVDLLNATGATLSQAVWLPLVAPPPAPAGYAHEALHEVATTPRFLAELPVGLLHTPGPRGPRQQRWWSAPEPEARPSRRCPQTAKMPLKNQPRLANLL